jgi:hypothetical protein
MKTLWKKVMWLTIWVGALIIGASLENRWHFMGGEGAGAPKASIPEIGSMLHVEASFDDGSFVATYAGSRMYYKANDKNQKLEAGKPYEVVDLKIQNGGHKKALTSIKAK